MAMYNKFKSNYLKPLIITIVAILAIFGISRAALTSSDHGMKWLPLGVHSVSAEESEESSGSLFTPVLKTLVDKEWGKDVKGGTGAYWSKVNGVSNGFLGLSTGSSAAYNYSNPKELKGQQQSTAYATAYMHALDALGLDHSASGDGISSAMSGIGRLLGGVLILIPLVVIAGVDQMFRVALHMADYLNIYKYFSTNQAPTGVFAPVYVSVRNLYQAFQDLGMVVTVLILAFMIWAYAVGWHKMNNGSQLGGVFGKILLRIFVIVAGPIIISMAFSSAIASLDGAYTSTPSYKSAIMSKIVNFEGWSKHSRLGLPSELSGKISATDIDNNPDVTSNQVLAINTKGAGMGVDSSDSQSAGNISFGRIMDMVTGWMTSSQYDAGQYMSSFQQRAVDDYFKKGSNRSELRGFDDKDVKLLITSGSLSTSNGKFVQGVEPKQGQSVSYNTSSGFGLSAIGMYNYLSSNSTGTGLQWTNLGKLANNVSKPVHYSYGFAGRGVQFMANYCSVLTSLIAIAYIAFKFAIRSFNAIFKGFFNTLVRFFTSAGSGSPVQLSKLLADFLSMMVQLFGGAFLYNLISTFVATMNMHSDEIFKPSAGAVAGVLPAGAASMVAQIMMSVLTWIVTWALVKYSGTFNKGVDEFLTQGIDRIMGKAGMEGGASNRNQGGLTSGLGVGGGAGGVGQDGHAGTGGGINNDGLDSNRSRLTNPDSWLGRQANKKADAKDVMDNADNQSFVGRRAALAKSKAGKGFRNQVRDAGFAGFANDMDNIAAMKRRDGGKDKPAELNKSSEDKESPNVKDGDETESNSPVLGGVGDKNEGDGSMDDLVDAQKVSSDDKEAHTIPKLEHDAEGKPTKQSVAKQLAATNHLVSDTSKSGKHKLPDATRKKIMADAGIAEPKSAEDANKLVQTASDDVRSAQMSLAQAKSPEEIESASQRLQASSEALMAVQDASSDFSTGKASDVAKGFTVGDAGTRAQALIDSNNTRESSNDSVDSSEQSMANIEQDAVQSATGVSASAIARGQQQARRVEKAASKSGTPVSKPNKPLIRAQARYENARQAMVESGVNSPGNAKKTAALNQAQSGYKTAMSNYTRNPTASAATQVRESQSQVRSAEDSIISTVKSSPLQSAYADSRTALNDTVSGLKSKGESVDTSSPVAQARVQEARAVQNAIQSRPNMAKTMTNLQGTQASSYKSYAKSNDTFMVLQKQAHADNFAPTAVGTNGKLGNVGALNHMANHKTIAIQEANTGTIGASNIAEKLNQMPEHQATRAFNDMSEKDRVVINRASASGIVNVAQPIVQQAQKAQAQSALRQSYKGSPLKTVVKQSRQVSNLVQKFKDVENNHDLKPAEKTKALVALKQERGQLQKSMGAKTYQSLTSGATRAKVEQKFQQVTQNAKNGHSMNVSGNLRNQNLIQAANNAMKRTEVRNGHKVRNNQIID